MNTDWHGFQKDGYPRVWVRMFSVFAESPFNDASAIGFSFYKLGLWQLSFALSV